MPRTSSADLHHKAKAGLSFHRPGLLCNGVRVRRQEDSGHAIATPQLSRRVHVRLETQTLPGRSNPKISQHSMQTRPQRPGAELLTLARHLRLLSKHESPCRTCMPIRGPEKPRAFLSARNLARSSRLGVTMWWRKSPCSHTTPCVACSGPGSGWIVCTACAARRRGSESSLLNDGGWVFFSEKKTPAGSWQGQSCTAAPALFNAYLFCQVWAVAASGRGLQVAVQTRFCRVAGRVTAAHRHDVQGCFWPGVGSGENEKRGQQRGLEMLT